MDSLLDRITDATCGEACWAAREDICRCSCNGANHGITRDGGVPERTSKIDGVMYKLIAVGGMEVEEEGRELSKEAGERYIYHCLRTKGSPYRVKTASKSQIDRWQELTVYRDPNHHEHWDWRKDARLLWERMGGVERRDEV